MKKRNTILLLGIISIIILMSVQVFILRGVWREKNEMFDLRYKLLSQEALNFMSRRNLPDGFDTVRYILANYADTVIMKDLPVIKDDSALLAAKKKEVYYYVSKLLDSQQDLSQFLSSYFERQRFEKDFNYEIAINYLEFINFDTRIPIYESRDFTNARPFSPEKNTKPRLRLQRSSRILVNRYFTEGNNYRLFFEYYIDFSDKQKLILKETTASLSMSALSIIVVVILFLITYRNLMQEKRLSNLKTDFINNMTHELKTPLSTITVAGRTLEMEQIRSNESKILETAKLIGKQSIHLNQLINMILEISMWERTQFQLDKKKVQIEDVMNDIVKSFKTGCGNCAALSQKYNFHGAKVDLDIIYFTTLVNNLLSNAVKYSEKDPVIDIEGFTKNNNVSIKFTDNGIGISKADQKHIFDKFYRASTGNIHKFKGLGLGLYYVKKIAEAHGGDVSVNSKPGKGSIFTVTIPY